jgi:hypothetical protein
MKAPEVGVQETPDPEAVADKDLPELVEAAR